MSVCERRYAATQFALLSAVYRAEPVGGMVWCRGCSRSGSGLPHYFFLTFALGVPAYRCCDACATPASRNEVAGAGGLVSPSHAPSRWR